MKLNIFGAKRQAAGLSASAKAKANKSAKKGAEAPKDEDVDAEGEDDEETGAEGDEDETTASDEEYTDAEGDDEESDAEGEDDETEASEEDEDVDAEGDEDETEASEEEEERPPVTKKGAKKGARKGAKKGASARADTSERQRIANIIDSREGGALPNLAKAFAFQSGMSSASAIRFMGAALKDLGGDGRAPVGKRGAAFRDAMSGQNPKATGFGGGKGGASGGEEDRVAGYVAVAAKMGLTAPSKS